MGELHRLWVFCFALCCFSQYPKQHGCAAQTEGLQVYLLGGIPRVFEGIPVTLICIGNSTVLSSITWFKDGVEVATCAGSDESLTVPGNLVNSSVSTVVNRNKIHCSLKIQHVTTMDHNGTYSCNSSMNGAATGDSYELDVLGREPFCQSMTMTFTGLQEYLAGDIAVFQCHNPVYMPTREVELMFTNTTDLVELSPSRTNYTNTFYFSAIITMTADLNGSIFTCSALPAGTTSPPLSDDYSCSLGPIRVFDSSFLIIEEVSDTTRLTLRCRLVPGTRGVNLSWSLDEELARDSIQTQEDIYSYLIFTAGASESSDLNATCTGLYDEEFYTTTHFVNVSGKAAVPGSGKPGNGDGLPSFVIPSAAIGGFILICIMVFIIIFIVNIRNGCKTREPSSEQHQSNDKGERHEKDISVSEGARYELEPRTSSGSYVNQNGSNYVNNAIDVVSDGNHEEAYDLPPLGMLGLSGGEEPQQSFTTVGPYFDPATSGHFTFGTDPGADVLGTSFTVEGRGEEDGKFLEDYSSIGPYYDSAATERPTERAEEKIYYDAAA